MHFVQQWYMNTNICVAYYVSIMQPLLPVAYHFAKFLCKKVLLELHSSTLLTSVDSVETVSQGYSSTVQ